MNINKRFMAGLVFLVLATALILLTRSDLLSDLFGKDEAGDDLSSEPLDLLFPEVGSGELVTSLVVTNKETGETLFAESQEGQWAILKAPEGSDTGLGVDEMRLFNATIGLPAMTPTRVLDNVETLTIFKLDEPLFEITFRTTGGGEYMLQVGDTNPGGGSYYVKLPSQGDIVYLVSVYSLSPTLELLENPPYIQPTPNPDATPTGGDSS